MSMLILVIWQTNVEDLPSSTISQGSTIGSGVTSLTMEYIPMAIITIVFAIGAVYLILMIRTLQRLGR
jgi:hypothetical protein